MPYGIHDLARLSGVSTRTLRYYDAVGLLKPAGTAGGGCRVYGSAEVDRLQQILFYREMGVPLAEIRRILDAPDADPQAALRAHLAELRRQRERLDALIRGVQDALRAGKGEIQMSDAEKFACFQRERAAENEAAYGPETRARYGDGAVDAAKAKFEGMDRTAWEQAEELRTRYETLLRRAALSGDPAGPEARAACEAHRQWLCLFWPEGAYSKAAHRSLGETYAEDPRFAAYYDALTPGCAAFFRDALRAFCR